jgi:hypothetical protein
MTTVDFDEVIKTLSEQIALLARDNAILKSLANQQANEISRLTAGVQGAPQEQEKTS